MHPLYPVRRSSAACVAVVSTGGAEGVVGVRVGRRALSDGWSGRRIIACGMRIRGRGRSSVERRRILGGWSGGGIREVKDVMGLCLGGGDGSKM